MEDTQANSFHILKASNSYTGATDGAVRRPSRALALPYCDGYPEGPVGGVSRCLSVVRTIQTVFIAVS